MGSSLAMARFRLTCFALLVAASGCVDNCSCGEGASDEAVETDAAAGVSRGATGTAKGSTSRQGPPPVRDGGAATLPPRRFTKLTDPELKQKLEPHAKALIQGELFEELRKPEELSRALPKKVGRFSAEGKPTAGKREASGGEWCVVQGVYKRADRTLRLKLTDAGRLPQLRKTIGESLTLVGNQATGNQRGLLIAGKPALASYDERRKVSRAVVVAGGRYVLELTLQGAESADEAAKAAESIDLAKLGVK